MRLRAVTERKVIGWNSRGVGMRAGSGMSCGAVSQRTAPAVSPVGRHAFFGQFAPCLVGLVERQAHAAQHVRRLGELDVAVRHHLDAVPPGIEEVEERTIEQFAARGLDQRTHRTAVIHHQAEMARAVAMFAAGLRQVDELVAHVDEGVGLALAAQREVEDAAVERRAPPRCRRPRARRGSCRPVFGLCHCGFSCCAFPAQMVATRFVRRGAALAASHRHASLCRTRRPERKRP